MAAGMYCCGWTRPDYLENTMLPDPAEYRANPGFYVIVTKKGQILTAYPEYRDKNDIFSTDTWRSSTGAIWPSDVVAYKKLDLPYQIIQELSNSPTLTSRTFRKVYGQHA